MKLVFMGTPEFAVPSLLQLSENGHNILSVVTVPDKQVGRGLKVRCSAVKKVALDLGIPILQPEDLSAKEFYQRLQQLHAELFVVVAFRILPASVFELPSAGTINLHSSLLPKLRGAAPINWAIINGHKETGVTTIFINTKVDTGDIILQKAVSIGDNETAGELHDRLAILGAETLTETVKLIETGSAPRVVQTGETTRAPKITRELCQINWQDSAEKIRNLIRGLSPYPGAYSYFAGQMIKIYSTVRSEISPEDKTFSPGDVVYTDVKSGRLLVQTGEGLLEIVELQPAGKKRMTAKEYLSGYELKPGDFFEVV